MILHELRDTTAYKHLMVAIPGTLPQAKACRFAPAKAVEKYREITTSIQRWLSFI